GPWRDSMVVARRAGRPRILVIQNCPVTPAGIVGEVASARADVATIFPHRGDPVPRTTGGLDGIVILGGPMHAGDDVGYPAFGALLALIRRCHAQGVPLFRIWLVAQLLARAFGKTVYPFGGVEVGYLPVELTPAAASDRLLDGLAPEQRIMQMHEDSFDLPDGAVLLMQNETCANQAFRLGAATYG